jgi:hypothetical protein
LTDTIIGKLDYGTVLSVLETKGDWLQVSDSKKTTGWLHRKVIWPSHRAVSAQDAIASDKPEVVALQEPAIAAPAAAPREEAAPIARVEEISPPMSLKKRVAAQEQTQPLVPGEIPVQEATTAPSEALAPDAGVRTSGFADKHGETATATKAEEYVRIAQFAAGANIRAAASVGLFHAVGGRS